MRFVLEAPQQAPYVTGTDRIAFNVISRLQRIDSDNTYTVICSPDFDYIPSAITVSNFNISYRKRRGPVGRVTRMPIAAVGLLRRRFLHHVSAFCSFHNLSSPPIKYAPTVSFALDLIPLIFPNWYHSSPAAHQMYLRRLTRARKNVDRFLAISQHTKSDLVTRLGIPADKIDVVYLAADEVFAPLSEPESLSRVRAKYKLPQRFLLTAGSNEPRKNVQTVADAFSQLPADLRKSYPLVVMGPPWRGRPIDDRYGSSIFVGEVADQDLPAIYSLASGFVFLSLYEGFGLPVLEAMACGTPVIASATTSVPEVVGDAGILVNPQDSTAVAGEMERLLDDPDLAQRLSDSGLKQAHSFCWQRTAQSVLETLTEVSRVS